MSEITVSCVKATLCTDNNGDTNTLLKFQDSASVKDDWGTSENAVSYFRFVKGDATKKLNKQGKLDLEQFEIVARVRTWTDKESGEEVTGTLKYLVAKRA